MNCGMTEVGLEGFRRIALFGKLIEKCSAEIFAVKNNL